MDAAGEKIIIYYFLLLPHHSHDDDNGIAICSALFHIAIVSRQIITATLGMALLHIRIYLHDVMSLKNDTAPNKLADFIFLLNN